MSESNWRSKYTTRGIAALSLIWVAFSLTTCSVYKCDHTSQRYDSAQYQTKHTSKEGETYCVDLTKPKTRACVTTPANADPDASYTHYDLKAQQEMAEWAYAMLLATITGVAVTAVGLVYVVLAFRLNAQATKAATDAAIASDAQAKAAQDSLDITRNLERPFCLFELFQHAEIKSREESIADFVNKIRPDRVHSPTAPTEFIIHNYGRTPAIIISYRANKIERWNNEGEPDPIDHMKVGANALPHGFAIRAGAASERLPTMDTFQADPEMMRGQKDYKKWFYIGFAIYRDVMGHFFIAGFGYWFDHSDDRWKLLRSTRSHDAFNYDFRIDPLTYALQDEDEEAAGGE